MAKSSSNTSNTSNTSAPSASVPVTVLAPTARPSAGRRGGRSGVTLPVLNASTVPNPCAAAWALFGGMYNEAVKAGQPVPTRGAMLLAAVEAGIATATARTQWQAWHTALQAAQKSAASA